MQKNILIAGPTGFLATYVLYELLKQPENSIVGLSRTELKEHKLQNNYTDTLSLQKAYPFFDEIYLLASYIPYGAFNIPNPAFVETNVKLVMELSVLYPSAKIIFSSSVSVYGLPKELPLRVDSPFENPDLYGLSKIAGEAIVQNHIRFAIIRFSSVIGHGMKVSTMIPKMIGFARNGSIMLMGDGRRLQNFIDVRDAAKMCLQGAEQQENIIALGVGKKSYSNLEVATIIKENIDCSIGFKGNDNNPSFVYENETSYRSLQFRPIYSLEQSIKDIITN